MADEKEPAGLSWLWGRRVDKCRNDPDMFKTQTGAQGDWPRRGQFQVMSDILEGSDHETFKTSHS